MQEELKNPQNSNTICVLLVYSCLFLFSCNYYCPTRNVANVSGGYVSINERSSQFLILSNGDYLNLSFRKDTLHISEGKWKINKSRCAIDFYNFMWMDLPKEEFWSQYKDRGFVSFEYKSWGLEIYMDNLNFKKLNENDFNLRLKHFVNQKEAVKKIYDSIDVEKHPPILKDLLAH